MATNKNKTGSSGMRIVWIPGKKKQPKGSYNPTKKSNLSASHQQKRIEPWTLGGSKGQEELLKSEIPGSDMASPSIMNVLPQTLGIGAACGDARPEEGAVGGMSAHHESPDYVNGELNAIKTDHEPSPSNSPPQPLSPRLGPLANIDEDEHENDFDVTKDHDDYCGASSNTATLLLKDRKRHILPINITTEKEIHTDDQDDDDEKKGGKCKQDIADGVPHMRGLNRKEAIERNYRAQEKHLGKDADPLDKKKAAKKKKKEKVKTGMNEKAVDCLYVSLMCCECSIQ